MNLYDRLLALQQIPHGYEQWHTYRELVTSLIIKQSKGMRIGILGAGRCQDLNLQRLSEHFQEVILIDKDEKAMKEAVAYYGLNTSDKIKVYVCDLIGISEDDYRHYADCLIKTLRASRGNVDELVDEALNHLERFYYQAGHHHVELPDCEQLVAIGLHSQLLSMLEWIWGVVLQQSAQDEGRVRYYIDQMNSELVKKFNILLMNHRSQRLILGFELGRADRMGHVQGAWQAREDFKVRVLSGMTTLVEEKNMVWPFDEKQGVVYHMSIQVFEKERK